MMLIQVGAPDPWPLFVCAATVIVLFGLAARLMLPGKLKAIYGLTIPLLLMLWLWYSRPDWVWRIWELL